jgi:hypothetical protein
LKFARPLASLLLEFRACFLQTKKRENIPAFQGGQRRHCTIEEIIEGTAVAALSLGFFIIQGGIGIKIMRPATATATAKC